MVKHKNCLDRKLSNIQYIFQATTNVLPDVRLCDRLISLKLHCYPLFYFFSNVMHACIYVLITDRLFPCLIISIICSEGHMVD